MRILVIKVLLLSLSNSFFVTAQESEHSNKNIEFDSVIKVIKQTYDVPGLAVCIIINNKAYYSNAIGVQGTNSSIPLTTKSIFHMASVSKPFVATAIMQLVESGKMNLDDKLVDHLPYFVMKDGRFKKITIKQILNHTSGIPDVEDYEWDSPQYDDGAAERYSKTFVNDLLDFKPGKDFNYSNASYNLLADVIAKVSGDTFEEYMTKNIFTPLGMSNSTFLKKDVPETFATQPHGMNNDLKMEVLDIYPYNRIHAPSSTLHSNIDDMIKWAMAWLNQGKLDDNQIFSEESYNDLTTVTQKVNKQIDICLSWFTVIQRSTNKRIYYHTGGDEGFRTFFGFIPEKKAAVILMGNNDYLQSDHTAAFLIKNFVNDDPTRWKKNIHFELKNLILTEGIDSCKSHYFNLKKHSSEDYEFKGSDLDQLGYWLLDREKNQQALEIFLFNIDLFSSDAGLYDSVGDAYVAMKNESKAIEWYEKALQLNPKQDFTIEKLKQIKTGQKDN